jgi:S-DNA-T family DNA segregation ATPase FtsK/SpoIIIE
MRKEYENINAWRGVVSPCLWDVFAAPSVDGSSVPADRTGCLDTAFDDLHLKAKVVGMKQGPVITRYMVQVGDGVRVRNIRNNLEDIAMRLGVSRKSIRLECSDGLVGIEIPNGTRATVPCRTIVTPADGSRVQFGSMEIGMGVDILGNPVKFDLSKAPHMLVAGQTGSGKSVFLNSMICNLLMNNNPLELEMVLIDPKGTEMKAYSVLPNVEVINNVKDAVNKLAYLVDVMEERYKMFTEATEKYGRPVRTLDDYMETVDDYLVGAGARKRIVVVIDEVADLMVCDRQGMETSIARIAAKARAAGIHLVLATQRPSRDVITGTIKANLPTRIAFRLPSQVDSKTILDEVGAESLLGKGDMLFKTADGVSRLHGCWMSDGDIANFIGAYVRFYNYLTGNGEVA